MRRRKWEARRHCCLQHVLKSDGSKGWEEGQSECPHGDCGEAWAIRRRICSNRHAVSPAILLPCFALSQHSPREEERRVASLGTIRAESSVRSESARRRDSTGKQRLTPSSTDGCRGRGEGHRTRGPCCRGAVSQVLSTLDAFPTHLQVHWIAAAAGLQHEQAKDHARRKGGQQNC